jgi:predicted metal-dependent hydrolase
MSTERSQITVSGLPVQIIRKDIKNLHLGVYPPSGRVRVAAPRRVTDAAVRLAVISRLGWIKRQRARFEGQARESAREMVSGESHYFQGRRYRLRVIEREGPSRVALSGRRFIELHVRAGLLPEQRERVLDRWYRQQLRQLIPPLLAKWEAALGVQAAGWGIKRMKTKWGTCNAETQRIWRNLELAKKPVRCLDYIVLHELTHLLERHHNERFLAILDAHLPQWRERRHELNSTPLAHAEWAEWYPQPR